MKRLAGIALILAAAALYVTFRGNLFGGLPGNPGIEPGERWVGPSCSDPWSHAALSGADEGYILTMRPNGTSGVRGLSLWLEPRNATLDFSQAVRVDANTTLFQAPSPPPVLAFRVAYVADGAVHDLSCAVRFVAVGADGSTQTLSTRGAP